MTAQIIALPLSADVAWERYQRLVQEREGNPALLRDRAHCESIIRAHTAFADAFKREQGL